MTAIEVLYGTPDHAIALETFVSTAVAVDDLLSALNRHIFSDTLRTQIVVVPPDEGSFLQKLVLVLTVVGTPFAALHSPVGSSYFQGLMGVTPVEYAKDLGLHHQKSIERFARTKEEERAVGLMLAHLVEQTLIAPNYRVPTLYGMNSVHRDISGPRNKFYNSLINDKKVSSFKFETGSQLTVGRERFTDLLIEYPDESEAEITVFSAKVRVVSPNWQEDDRKRLWKGYRSDGTELYFHITDPQFWQLCYSGEISPTTHDVLSAQFVSRRENGEKAKVYAANVLIYNETSISPWTSEEEIALKYGMPPEGRANFRQGRLF